MGADRRQGGREDEGAVYGAVQAHCRDDQKEEGGGRVDHGPHIPQTSCLPSSRNKLSIFYTVH